MLYKIINVLFGTHQWKIIYRKKNNSNWIEFNQPKNLSRADPFLIKEKGCFYVFFEEFFIEKGNGYLCCATLDFKNEKLINKKIILKKNYHLSFPFVFKENNKFYLIPETSKEKRIDLYEFISFPYKLKFVKTLLRGYKAADSVLYKHENIWFLLTNIERTKNDLNSKDLSIFQSKSLLNGSFVQKHKNPVVSDIQFARNAGKIIFSDNILFRVSQDCKKRYGHKVNLMKIKKLTENHYQEILFRKIEPPNGYIAFHTYNVCDGVIIGDAKIVKKDIKTLFSNFLKLIFICKKKLHEIFSFF